MCPRPHSLLARESREGAFQKPETPSPRNACELLPPPGPTPSSSFSSQRRTWRAWGWEQGGGEVGIGGGTWLHFHNRHLKINYFISSSNEKLCSPPPSFTPCAAHYESVFLPHPVITSHLEWLCSVCLKSAILRKVNHFKGHSVCNLLVEF